MDKELFELCKDVYERLPMWDNAEKCYAYIDDYSPGTDYWRVIPLHEDNVDGVDEWHPLYTSDYLLEKLPYSMPTATKIDLPYFLYVNGSPDHDWLAYYGREGEMGTWKDVLVYSDTPLKALLKLAIALDEAGKLK